MAIPTSLVLVPLLLAFVLGVLTCYRLNPERLLSLPFLFLVSPLVLFVTYVGLDAAGAVPARWSVLYLGAALASLVIAVRRTRLPKLQAHGR